MMEYEVLFRGKRLDNGEWVYGIPATLINLSGAPYTAIIPIYSFANDLAGLKSVDPSTVGQYTGLTDKNGVKIFVEDIISYNGSREVVRFDTSLRIPCFTTGIGRGSSTAPHPYKISVRHVVIGNIHDNPELLGGAK